MKNRKNRIVIVILVGLVFFSSSIALLMYSKQSQTKEVNNLLIEVFASSKALKKGVLIGASDIKSIKLPKSYMAFTPLTQSEIIGRYTSVDILAGEPFRKEKISILKPKAPKKRVSRVVEEVEPKELAPKVYNDTITIPLTLFKNIDNTLKKGDFIDIVSIKSKKSKNTEISFETKYIALHIPIDSFVHNYSSVKTFISKDEDENLVAADSVVFKMDPDDIKNLLSLYYKAQELNANRVHNTKKANIGHLWMVKCSEVIDESAQKKKERMLVDYIVQKKRRKFTPRVSISYEN